MRVLIVLTSSPCFEFGLEMSTACGPITGWRSDGHQAATGWPSCLRMHDGLELAQPSRAHRRPRLYKVDDGVGEAQLARRLHRAGDEPAGEGWGQSAITA